MVDDALPVHFLMFNVDARDGVSRAVVTLANELASTRPVEIISLYRRHDGPAYAISEQIQVTYIFDHAPARKTNPDGTRSRQPGPTYSRWPVTRHPVRNLLARRESRLTLGFGFPNLSRLTDRALARTLGSIESGVLISTRPTLHLLAAQLARPGVITIGQDHLNFLTRSKETGSLPMIEEACRHGLDAFVTLTGADAVDYRALLATTRTRVETIPNALSWPVDPGERHQNRVIVAAGRLVPRKGMRRLIQAFAPVAKRHPDWQLRIYGDGRLKPDLTTLVAELDLTDQIHLEGHVSDMPAAFDAASVFASASAAEGFPMVMLEALSKGLPLVSFDCPRGPSDIIDDGKNGLLIPDGDVPALSDALERMVADDDGRRAMGAQALADADQYVGARIAARWAALIDELVARAQEPSVID